MLVSHVIRNPEERGVEFFLQCGIVDDILECQAHAEHPLIAGIAVDGEAYVATAQHRLPASFDKELRASGPAREKFEQFLLRIGQVFGMELSDAVGLGQFIHVGVKPFGKPADDRCTAKAVVVAREGI